MLSIALIIRVVDKRVTFGVCFVRTFLLLFLLFRAKVMVKSNFSMVFDLVRVKRALLLIDQQ